MPDPRDLRDAYQNRAVLPGATAPRTANRPTDRAGGDTEPPKVEYARPPDRE